MKIFIVLLALCCLVCGACTIVFAQQQTVGLIKNTADSYNGYTLFAPTDYTLTYLIDNCGRTVKTWTSKYKPGQAVYLLEDGSLLHTARPETNKTFGSTGGSGGRVERYDWDGNLLWGFDYSGATYHQHHDAIMLPNGNILFPSWDSKTQAEATAAGRKTSLYPVGGLWSDKIVEVKPIGKDSGVVVWEWRVWDHLVQDNDAAKANYGAVVEHPELLDVNFLNKEKASTDWIHFNGLSYNAELDQIIVSSRELSEVFIIDHSTTAAEATTHKGGKQGKGGDFLYRWGNPESYRRGTSADRKLFGQHNPQWIAKGLSGAGNLMVFNNGDERPDGMYSTIEEFQSPVTATGGYTLGTSTSATYLPSTSVWTYKAANPTSFFANRISSTQRLANGNTLICEGTKGNFFEITPTGTTVWQYKNPVGSAGPVEQGKSPMPSNSFRANRYAPSYAGLKGRTLTPGTPVELNPLSSNCTITTDVRTPAPAQNNETLLTVLPNPASDQIVVNFTVIKNERVKLALYNVLGQETLLLFDADLNVGNYTLPFSIAQAPYSVAFCRLQVGNVIQTVVLHCIR